MLCNAVGGGVLAFPEKSVTKVYGSRGWGVSFPGKKRYEGVRFNVISVTRGWVGVKFPGKKRYVTLEWPLASICMFTNLK